MSEPIPQPVGDAVASALAQIAAVKKTRPKNEAQARVKAAELVRLNSIMKMAVANVTEGKAVQRVASNGGNGGDVVATSLSDGVLKALAESLVPFIKEVITDATVPLDARIIALEQLPTQKYCGVWNETRTYFTGDSVTEGGSNWHCDKSNTGIRPGSGSAEKVWTLSVKKGRDAKDVAKDIRALEQRLAALERKPGR